MLRFTLLVDGDYAYRVYNGDTLIDADGFGADPDELLGDILADLTEHHADHVAGELATGLMHYYGEDVGNAAVLERAAALDGPNDRGFKFTLVADRGFVWRAYNGTVLVAADVYPDGEPLANVLQMLRYYHGLHVAGELPIHTVHYFGDLFKSKSALAEDAPHVKWPAA